MIFAYRMIDKHNYEEANIIVRGVWAYPFPARDDPEIVHQQVRMVYTLGEQHAGKILFKVIDKYHKEGRVSLDKLEYLEPASEEWPFKFLGGKDE